MEILLIRHGKTAGNKQGRYVGRTDEPVLPEYLDELKTSKWMQKHPDHIYTSPLLRCRQTADALFDRNDFARKEDTVSVQSGKSLSMPGKNLTVIPDLIETDFGDFEYQTYEDLNGNPVYQAWIDSGGMSAFPNGESGVEFRQRACEAFRHCLEDARLNGYDNIAIVTHGGVIMAIMETFVRPKADFYSWQVKNGCGFVLKEREDRLFEVITE